MKLSNLQSDPSHFPLLGNDNKFSFERRGNIRLITLVIRGAQILVSHSTTLLFYLTLIFFYHRACC